MGKVIAVTNQKGGVGKTTTAVNLSAALGSKGKKTLLVDVDPQGNATSGLGVDKRGSDKSVYNVLIDNFPAKDVIVKTDFDNVFLIPSSINLAGAEIELIDMENREFSLKNAIEPLKNDFDYIIIDCPPSLGLINTNALSCSDSIIIPIQCEYYALEGLSQLINTTRKIKKSYNKYLEIESVLLTMFDSRLNLSRQVANEVKKFFPGKVFKTVIPRSVRISEAPSFGEPITYYDKNSKGSLSYQSLAEELIERN